MRVERPTYWRCDHCHERSPLVSAEGWLGAPVFPRGWSRLDVYSTSEESVNLYSKDETHACPECTRVMLDAAYEANHA